MQTLILKFLLASSLRLTLYIDGDNLKKVNQNIQKIKKFCLYWFTFYDFLI
jgi:hypothetical protein